MPGRSVTLDVRFVPVEVVCASIARQAGVSVVVESEFAGRVVSLQLTEAPAVVALELLGRAVGASIVDVDGVIYLGQVAPGDSAVLVCSCPNLPANAREVVTGVLGGEAQVSVLPGGVLVVVGRARSLARVRSLVEQMRAAAPGAFVIQAYVLEASESVFRDLQLGAPSLSVTGSVGRGADFLSLRAFVESQLSAGVDSGSGWSVETPLLCCADGEQSSIVRSRTVYVATSNFTSSGQGVSGGLQAVNVESGFRVKAVSLDALRSRLDVEWRASDLESVSGLPRVRSDVFTSSVVVDQGAIAYVGQFARSADGSVQRLGVGRILGFSGQAESRILALWLRCVRLATGAAESEEKKAPLSVGADAGQGGRGCRQDTVLRRRMQARSNSSTLALPTSTS